MLSASAEQLPRRAALFDLSRSYLVWFVKQQRSEQAMPRVRPSTGVSASSGTATIKQHQFST